MESTTTGTSSATAVDVSFNSQHYSIPLSHSGAAGIERITQVQVDLLAGVPTESGDKTLTGVISRNKSAVIRSKRLLNVGHLISCWMLLLKTDATNIAAIQEAHPQDDSSHNVMALVAAILRHGEDAYVTVAHNLALGVVHDIKSELVDDSVFVDKLLKLLLANASTGEITSARVLDELVPSAVREMSASETYRTVRVCQRWLNHHFDTLAAHYQPSMPELTLPVLNSLEDLAQHIRKAMLQPGVDDKFTDLFEPFHRLSAVYEERAKSKHQPVNDHVTQIDHKAEDDDKSSSSVRKRQSDVADDDSDPQVPNTKKAKVVGGGGDEKHDTGFGSGAKRRGRKPGSVVIGGKVVPPSSPSPLVDLSTTAAEAVKIKVGSMVEKKANGEPRSDKHDRLGEDSGGAPSEGMTVQ